MNNISKIFSICGWFAFGYFACQDPTKGFISAVGAVALMEVCYHIDKRAGGLDQILQRLDYLEETIDGAADNQALIVNELMITAENIQSDSDFAQGEKFGLNEAQEVVNRRFNDLYKKLTSEKEEKSKHS